jgi:hypothetical protein
MRLNINELFKIDKLDGMLPKPRLLLLLRLARDLWVSVLSARLRCHLNELELSVEIVPL